MCIVCWPVAENYILPEHLQLSIFRLHSFSRYGSYPSSNIPVTLGQRSGNIKKGEISGITAPVAQG